MLITNQNILNNFKSILIQNGYEGDVMKENINGQDVLLFSFVKLIDDPNSKFSMAFMVNSGTYGFTDGRAALHYLTMRMEESQDQEFGLPEALQRLNVLEGEFIIKTANKLLGI